ncbi:MAG: CRTAC1 family protein, partial [Limisphaerales bacterium]
MKSYPRITALTALCLLALAGLLCFSPQKNSDPTQTTPPPQSRYQPSPETLQLVNTIEALELQALETVWLPELIAQPCSQFIEEFWNHLNSSTNRLLSLTQITPTPVTLPSWPKSPPDSRNIQHRRPSPPHSTLPYSNWTNLLHSLHHQGWSLLEFELRHESFETNASGLPLRSGLYAAAHCSHPTTQLHITLQGRLWIDWTPTQPHQPAIPHQINATQLELKTRQGPPAFHPSFTTTIPPPNQDYSLDPLLVHDLNHDHTSEIILAAGNLLYQRTPSGSYNPLPLCQIPTRSITSAILADITHDGITDFVCATLKGLTVYPGSTNSITFSLPHYSAWNAPADWHYPMSISAGDIDGDSDLDLFIGQYRIPYSDNSFPTPFYNALDGFPSFLLLNDGTGHFTDITPTSGLSTKRNRRTYSASLVHLNDDNLLDLLVVSDFAGLDLYLNTSNASFTDQTSQLIPNPYAFGMAHAFADFNRDGHQDLLMIGMHSPTVDRLNTLNLWRTENPLEQTMRTNMTHGNRLYLSHPNSPFSSPTWTHSIARSGWSWGCTALDVENDGWPDVYIANGLESRTSVHDYEGEYWLHDRFVGAQSTNHALHYYFQGKFARTRGQGDSYGGYDRNRLFLNQTGHGFTDVGHLLGVGFQEDGRNVVSDDLNNDGKMDLIITGYDLFPNPQLTLRVLENHIPESGNWIGFHLPSTVAPGTRITLHANSFTTTRQITSGDSHRSQHPPHLHFGLGQIQQISHAEIRWPSGQVTLLPHPAINHYHPL